MTGHRPHPTRLLVALDLFVAAGAWAGTAAFAAGRLDAPAGWLLGQTAFVGLSPLQPAYLLLAGSLAGLAVELRRAMRVPSAPRAAARQSTARST